jgi:hypothetical protein
VNVVFTGPAYDGSGHSILRAHLASATIAQGLKVQPSVMASTDLLIASRKDTVKAAGAMQRGVKVLTYPEFINRYLSGQAIATGGKPNKYTDKVDLDLLVPDFTGADGLDAAYVL